jgi:hypothetical protein
MRKERADMKALTGLLLVAIGLAVMLWCGEARALFAGIEETAVEEGDNDEPGEAAPGRNSPIRGGAAGNPRRLTSAFDRDPMPEMPETMPAEVARRAETWSSRPRNSKRFDRLLHGDAYVPPAPGHPLARPATEAAPATRPAGGRGLDCLVGAIVVGGLALIGFLLWRSHGRG